jgi:ADP-heptose:LPS heptosyltransferase
VKRKLILRNHLSPGDLVMLTAAVRDLHRHNPGKFLTDVRSSCPELWEHNPHLTPLRDADPEAEQIECHYPLIDRSNQAPCHCLHGFADFLGDRLQVPLRPTAFRGDIHLSREERRWKSIVHELGGSDLPFWIVNAGGKFDFTIKWWDWRRYQQVVDYFRGKILFVQVGEIGHYHPPLRHVVDLRGRTDLRQLVRLTYHAQGVLCGVTALMHLAAAVPTRPDRPRARAAVIIAGGREPTHWEAYPQHQFIHTIGALPCCQTGGCWRARIRALGDGEKEDAPELLCTRVVGDLPRCMDMITAEEVIRRVELYFTGGANRFLSIRQQPAARRAIQRSLVGPRFETTIHLGTVRAALDLAATEARAAVAPALKGRGILLLVAAAEEIVEALAGMRWVRASADHLPIECWHSVALPARAAALLRAAKAKLVDCSHVTRSAPPLAGPELRLHALAQTKLREVLVLDAGVFPRVTPDALFARPAFRKNNAVFFGAQPNVARVGVWKLCSLNFPRRTMNAAHFVLDRSRWWSALQLWRWIVDRTYFFNGYVDGDGGAAQLAFAKLGSPPPLGRSSAAFWSVDSAAPAPALVERHRREARRDLEF